jgi:hypothetical protein
MLKCVMIDLTELLSTLAFNTKQVSLQEVVGLNLLLRMVDSAPRKARKSQCIQTEASGGSKGKLRTDRGVFVWQCVTSSVL